MVDAKFWKIIRLSVLVLLNIVVFGMCLAFVGCRSETKAISPPQWYGVRSTLLGSFGPGSEFDRLRDYLIADGFSEMRPEKGDAYFREDPSTGTAVRHNVLYAQCYKWYGKGMYQTQVSVLAILDEESRMVLEIYVWPTHTGL